MVRVKEQLRLFVDLEGAPCSAWAEHPCTALPHRVAVSFSRPEPQNPLVLAVAEWAGEPIVVNLEIAASKSFDEGKEGEMNSLLCA